MYSRDEAHQLKQAFWTTFGKWSTTKRKRLGMREKWLLNKTGVHGCRFRFSAEGKQVGVHLDIIEKQDDLKMDILNKLIGLKAFFEQAIPESIHWDVEKAQTTTCGLSVYMNDYSLMNKDHWPTIFEFFYSRMLALEGVFDEFKELLKP